jgi:parallel beta-helix repeat protein
MRVAFAQYELGEWWSRRLRLFPVHCSFAGASMRDARCFTLPLLVLITIGSVAAADVQATARSVVFFVGAEGNDSWPGTADKPFGTLEHARDVLRRERRAAPDRAATVIVRGTLARTAVFELDARDSGTPGHSVVYRDDASAGAIRGGARLTKFAPVSDEKIRNRVSPEARANVVVADLRAAGIVDCGALTARGFGRVSTPAACELFVDGVPMQLARWPNRGEFATIASGVVPETNALREVLGKLDGGFYYIGDRPRRWAKLDDIWVHGYWDYDWADTYEHVRSVDVDKRIIRSDPPYGTYGFRAGQRFYFLNVLEELDEPGEYYIDRDGGKLYFWPPTPLKGRTVVLSISNEPLLRIQGASNIIVSGLTFDGGRGDGIEIDNSSNIRIERCTIRNAGNRGIVIRGGSDNAVAACDISATGDGAIDIAAGDRMTLTLARTRIVNNDIHDYARTVRTYTPGVLASGVGIEIAHNRIHNSPHAAIVFSGNDVTISDNEIYDACLETGDSGAIYMGRDYSFRDNVVGGNFIHHVYGLGAIAIYMDDCVSGTSITSNLLWSVSYGIVLGGGRDFRLENNVCVDCGRGVLADGRCGDANPPWHDMVYRTMLPRLEAVHWKQPPYSTRYPEMLLLAKYLDDPKQPGIPPENNVVTHNIAGGGTWMLASAAQFLVSKDNFAGMDPHFVDAAHGDFRLRPDSPAFAIGFKPIPVESIGLVKDADREIVPPRRLMVASIEVMKPAVNGETITPAVVRYTLTNLGQTTELGKETLFAAPIGDGDIVGGSTIAYGLKPFESVVKIVTVRPRPGAKRLQLVEYREGESGPHRVFEIPMQAH